MKNNIELPEIETYILYNSQNLDLMWQIQPTNLKYQLDIETFVPTNQENLDDFVWAIYLSMHSNHSLFSYMDNRRRRLQQRMSYNEAFDFLFKIVPMNYWPNLRLGIRPRFRGLFEQRRDLAMPEYQQFNQFGFFT